MTNAMKGHLIHLSEGNEHYESTKLCVCIKKKVHFWYATPSSQGVGRTYASHMVPCDCKPAEPDTEIPKMFAPFLRRILAGESIEAVQQEMLAAHSHDAVWEIGQHRRIYHP